MASTTASIYLHNIDSLVLTRLKQEAKTRNISVNQLIIFLLRRDLGLTKKKLKILNHDLDRLAGTWSKKEAKQFFDSIADMEKIDKDIWL